MDTLHTFWGIILPTIKLKVYTFGAYELSNREITVEGVQGLEAV